MRRVCFATGTRAEFGLMQTTLRAIESHPGLSLSIVATGMHLDPSAGRSVESIRRDGWTVDAEVPWPSTTSPTELAVATGEATAGLAEAFEAVEADVVLVVGDRVEATCRGDGGSSVEPPRRPRPWRRPRGRAAR